MLWRFYSSFETLLILNVYPGVTVYYTLLIFSTMTEKTSSCSAKSSISIHRNLISNFGIVKKSDYFWTRVYTYIKTKKIPCFDSGFCMFNRTKHLSIDLDTDMPLTTQNMNNLSRRTFHLFLIAFKYILFPVFPLSLVAMKSNKHLDISLNFQNHLKHCLVWKCWLHNFVIS